MSNMLHILGASLAQATGKQEILCRGLLRLSVLDSVEHLRQSSDLKQVMAHMQTMTYQDWKAFVEGAVLSQRLENIGVSRPADVVAQLKQTLADAQSLLTMSAR